jgi:tetratricopeptide (TPR) repeat protein
MKEEREELVKRVFPQLRKLCEQRGVVFSEVDLRWGITDEQRAEGKVLPICFAEMNECRPFFIGILGERYGWIPDSIPDDLVENEPWMKNHPRSSVTELEILHGVLNDPGVALHSYFYFRDPSYIDTLPESIREEMVEHPFPFEVNKYGIEDAERRCEKRRQKLYRLKERIRQSGLKYHDNYLNPQHLGELVLKDFTSLVDQIFPEGTQPDPLEKEALEHEHYARGKQRVYIGRQDYFDRIDRHIESSNPPLVVVGGSGAGKTALIANWSARFRNENPDIPVIMHFIGSSPYSSDWVEMLRRILGEFKKRFEIDEEIPSEPDKLRDIFARWLHMVSMKGRIVLVIDDLNQLEDIDNAPDLVWLPPHIPANIRIVLSTSEGRSLDAIRNYGWEIMKVFPLDDNERKTLIRNYLAQYRKSLGEDRIEKIASADQTRNPLFLRTLLEELRISGEHEKLDDRIQYYLMSSSIPELFSKILERCQSDYNRDKPGMVGEAMSLIWGSRHGLMPTELFDLLGDNGKPMPQAFWAPFYFALEKMFISRSGKINFSHPYIRQAVQERHLFTTDLQKETHSRIADYFNRIDMSSRKIDELPWQYLKSVQYQRLHGILSDLSFLKSASDKNPYEIRRYWAFLESNTEFRIPDSYADVINNPENVDYGITRYLSDLLYDTGNLDHAFMLEKYLTDHYRQTGDTRRMLKALRNQAVILKIHGELDQSRQILLEVETVSKDINNLIEYHRAIGNRGILLYNQADPDGAMELFLEQEKICREISDKAGLVMSLGNQALVLSRKKEYDKALNLHKEQERIYRELGDPAGIARCLGNQAVVHGKMKNMDCALELFKEQERICREIGDKRSLQKSMGNQAMIMEERGDFDGAMILHIEKENICREIGLPDSLAISLANQAENLMKRGFLDDALDKAEEAFEIANTHGYTMLLKEILPILEQIKEKMK